MKSIAYMSVAELEQLRAGWVNDSTPRKNDDFRERTIATLDKRSAELKAKWPRKETRPKAKLRRLGLLPPVENATDRT